MTLAGRVCVVTGASRGLGRSIADHLASQGALLALCARDGDTLATVAGDLRARHGTEVHAATADVSDAHAMQSFAQTSRDQLGPAYALVTNAGVLGPVGPIDMTDPEEWSGALAVNVLGVVHAMQAFVPQMIEAADGVVLNVLGGGIGGDGVQSYIDAYVASKGAVAVLTETTARELAPRGVRVNAFSPGALATELMRPVLAAGAAVAGDELLATARAIYDDLTPGDELDGAIAELVDFLLGEESAALTGRLLSVRWNPVEQLRREIDAIAGSTRYRLRRIDAELYLARDDVVSDSQETA